MNCEVTNYVIRTRGIIRKSDILPKNKSIFPKNVGAQVSMEFSSNELSALITIEKKINILGAVLELPGKQLCQSSPFPQKWAKWAELAAQFSW